MTNTKELADKITKLRAEAEAFIDERANLLKLDAPGVPIGVLRNLLTNREPGCICKAALAEIDGAA